MKRRERSTPTLSLLTSKRKFSLPPIDNCESPPHQYLVSPHYKKIVSFSSFPAVNTSLYKGCNSQLKSFNSERYSTNGMNEVSKQLKKQRSRKMSRRVEIRHSESELAHERVLMRVREQRLSREKEGCREGIRLIHSRLMKLL